MARLIGLDEAGRGPWAGPLVVAAVRLKVGNKLPDWVCDSKTLSEAKIINAYHKIVDLLDIGLSVVEPEVIDRLGLADAVRRGFTDSLEELGYDSNDEALVDGNINYLAQLNLKSLAITGGDATEPIISAASIVAKFKRDEIMRTLAIYYPEYGLEKSKGYGTAAHRQALLEHGPVQGLHRMTYKPVVEAKLRFNTRKEGG